MSSMFKGASSFNEPLDMWDVSHVTDVSYMFNPRDRVQLGPERLERHQGPPRTCYSPARRLRQIICRSGPGSASPLLKE